VPTMVGHGAYSRESPFDVVKHEYAGACDAPGYIELLEVRDAPEGRSSFVIHSWVGGRGSVYYEWVDLERAKAAWSLLFTRMTQGDIETVIRADGCLRACDCKDEGEPWFYGGDL
jgi:hypothetical protein